MRRRPDDRGAQARNDVVPDHPSLIRAGLRPHRPGPRRSNPWTRPTSGVAAMLTRTGPAKVQYRPWAGRRITAEAGGRKRCIESNENDLIAFDYLMFTTLSGRVVTHVVEP